MTTPTQPQAETTIAVLGEVMKERARQYAKWGEQNHDDGTGATFHRNHRENAKTVCEANARLGCVNWCDILSEEFWEAVAETAPARLRAELIQVAAAAVAWVEAIDRRRT